MFFVVAKQNSSPTMTHAHNEQATDYRIKCNFPGCESFSDQRFCEEHRRESSMLNGAVQCERCEGGRPCEYPENRAAVDATFLRAIVETDPEREASEEAAIRACWTGIGIGLAINLALVGVLSYAMGEVGANALEFITFGGGVLWLGFGLLFLFGTPYIPGAPPPSSLPDERTIEFQEAQRSTECPFRYLKHLRAEAGKSHSSRIGRRVTLALVVAYLCHVVAFFFNE